MTGKKAIYIPARTATVEIKASAAIRKLYPAQSYRD
jgi:hypothetical protein